MGSNFAQKVWNFHQQTTRWERPYSFAKMEGIVVGWDMLLNDKTPAKVRARILNGMFQWPQVKGVDWSGLYHRLYFGVGDEGITPKEKEVLQSLYEEFLLSGGFKQISLSVEDVL